VKTNHHYFDGSDSIGQTAFSMPTNDVLDKRKLQPELDNLLVTARNTVEPDRTKCLVNVLQSAMK
jgi:hypothetical protein